MWLAFLLSQAASGVVPKHDTVFSVAERAMAVLHEQDSVYYGHMKESLSQQTSKINVKVECVWWGGVLWCGGVCCGVGCGNV